MGEGLGRRTAGVQAPRYTLPNGASATTKRVLFRMFTVTHRKVDLTKEYWNNIFQPSLRIWGAGDTQNLDVWCSMSASCIARDETRN
jgi:hypothetical protein